MIFFTESYSNLGRQTYDVEAETKINPAVIVAINSNGNLVEASDTAGLTVVGFSRGLADNSATGSSAGDVTCSVAPFGIVACAYESLSKTDIMSDVYIKDSSTVWDISSSSNQIIAGKLINIINNFATVLIKP